MTVKEFWQLADICKSYEFFWLTV